MPEIAHVTLKMILALGILIAFAYMAIGIATIVGDNAKEKRDAYNNAPHCRSAEIHCGFE